MQIFVFNVNYQEMMQNIIVVVRDLVVRDLDPLHNQNIVHCEPEIHIGALYYITQRFTYMQYVFQSEFA